MSLDREERIDLILRNLVDEVPVSIPTNFISSPAFRTAVAAMVDADTEPPADGKVSNAELAANFLQSTLATGWVVFKEGGSAPLDAAMLMANGAKERANRVAELLREAADLMAEPDGALLPDTLAPEDLPGDVRRLDHIVQLAAEGGLSNVLKQFADNLDALSHEQLVSRALRGHAVMTLTLAPELAGEAGRANDPKSRNRGLFVRGISRLIPAGLKERGALIAHLASLTGEEFTRYQVASVLKNKLP